MLKARKIARKLPIIRYIFYGMHKKIKTPCKVQEFYLSSPLYIVVTYCVHKRQKPFIAQLTLAWSSSLCADGAAGALQRSEEPSLQSQTIRLAVPRHGPRAVSENGSHTSLTPEVNALEPSTGDCEFLSFRTGWRLLQFNTLSQKYA